LILSLRLRHPCGQAIIHKPHDLHLSARIDTFAIAYSSFYIPFREPLEL
jgi:hypothetical protein